ncbi:MAG: serine/threonine protein kinase [Fuerstiella sp.]|nr:serine/threonine protein kinase [Fuerstiella sp.]
MSRSLSDLHELQSLSSEERDELLGRLAEEFEFRIRRGECPLVAEYTERYPDLAADIESVFTTIVTLEGIKADDARDAEGRVSLAGGRVDQLGEYRVVREISRGGMGIVFEAEQVSLQRRVALKVLPRRMILQTEERDRFEREAQLAASLHHSNIVPVHGCGTDDGYQFYAMQLIDGTSLNELQEHELTSKRVAEIGVQVAGALHYAHKQGVMHRDIKPENLIEDQNGRIWITDFGLAADSTSVSDGGAGGTKKYMAPERATGLCKAPADVFSLGMTLQTLLSDLAEDSVSPDLTAVIDRAIDHNWQNRYQTAGELAEDLQRFLDHWPVKARKLSWFGRGLRLTRRNPALSVCLGLLFGLAWVMAILSHRNYLQSEQQKLQLFGKMSVVDALFQSNYPGRDKLSQLSEVKDSRSTQIADPTLDDHITMLRYLPDTKIDRLTDLSPDLIRAAIAARRDVGQAKKHLGRLTDARRALQYALQATDRWMFKCNTTSPFSPETTEAVLSAATLRNDLSAVLEEEMKLDEAEVLRNEALGLLDRIPLPKRNSTEYAEQLAEAHLGLGTFRPERVGLFGIWYQLDVAGHDFTIKETRETDHLDAALNVLQVSSLMHVPRIKTLIARTLVERIRWKRMLGTSWHHDDRRAEELMRELTLEFPRQANYRYVYSIVLANIRLPWDPITRTEYEIIRLRLERSLELVHSLTQNQPRRTDYIQTEVDVRHLLAELAIRCTVEGDTKLDFEVAVSMQGYLNESMTAGFSGHVRKSLLEWRFAEWLDFNEKHDQAETYRDYARQQFQLISSHDSSEPCVVAAREIIIDGTRTLTSLTERVAVGPEKTQQTE